MKYALPILLLAAVCASHVGVQAQPAPVKAMSAIDILEALVSSDPGLRDRGATELKLMTDQTGQALGAEIIRVEVREAVIALRRVGMADTTPAAIAACCALDSKEVTVRIAALDALVAMKPAGVSAAGKQFTPARLAVLRQLITDSDYVRLQCEATQEDEEGQLAPPVREALSLSILLDRFFGVKGMPMLMRQISELMLGDDPGDETKKTAHRRWLEERLRRGAGLWCEAIWIEDPAIKFNFSPIAPYAERAKAVSRINRLLTDLEKQDVTYAEVSFKGKRYGDVLHDLLGGEVLDIKAAAWFRLHWWSGEDTIICGEGYAAEVDKYAAMRRPERSRGFSKLKSWWVEYRTATD